MNNFKKITVAFFLTVAVHIGSLPSLYAQYTQSIDTLKFQPLQAGVDIYGFTGNLSWRTIYIPTAGGLIKESETQLFVGFRNIEMLNANFGIGYKFFSIVYLSGFFEGVGLGGIGAGPIIRYYPIESVRWQPYLQAGFAGGYNLALSDAGGINDVDGFRFRSSLRFGLAYKVSNAFGLFLEVGPSWEYNQSLQLDSHALQAQIGILWYVY